MKRFHLIVLSLFLFSPVVYSNPSPEIPVHYQPLVERLSQDGLDKESLSRLFADPRAELVPSAMTINIYSKETKDIYAPFLTPESIQLSKKFLHDNQMILRQMEKEFHVDKEVVVAILLVESRFGENIGKHRVIPTLASMALIDSPENLDRNYLRLLESDPEISYEWLEELSKRRSKWAYHELKCFLRIVRNESMDPLEVRGSYAGALGMAQFIPSSYLAHAHGPTGLEQWLLGKQEAIFSIGNYLRNHGWKKNLPVERKRRILWLYNRSEPYIETILQVAKKIKSTQKTT